jgi:Zn-dependent peptidase ImmA (M78 family)
MPSHADSSTIERIATLMAQTGTDPNLVAEALHLPADVSLAAVLNGDHVMSLSDVLSVAEVMNVPAMVLTGQVPMDRNLATSLRLGLIEAAETPAEALSYARMLLDHLAVLDAWTQPTRSRLEGLAVSRDTHYISAGKRTAARVRDMLGIGDEPIPDLVDLVESTGIPVAFQSMPQGIHGINVRDDLPTRTLRAIMVRSEDWWVRQRYTLAHELCHGLYNDDGQVIVDKVDVPETLPELRAESFARHLLLPESALRAEVRRSVRARETVDSLIARLVVTYGVSREVVLRALSSDKQAGVHNLDGVRAQPVGATMAAGGLAAEWAELCRDQHESSGSPWLVERAVEAFSQGWVGAAFVADLLGETEEATMELLAEQGWTPQSP